MHLNKEDADAEHVGLLLFCVVFYLELVVH